MMLATGFYELNGIIKKANIIKFIKSQRIEWFANMITENYRFPTELHYRRLRRRHQERWILE